MTFRRNPAFNAELRASPQFKLGLRAEARVAMRFANDIATRAHLPWMPRPGHRHNPVVVEADPTGIMLVNTDYAGDMAEFGSVNNPAHAPLRRGARMAGLRLREQ